MSTGDLFGVVAPRPKLTDEAVLAEAVDAMLPDLAEWNGGKLTDEGEQNARRLLRGMVHLDAYCMAREFEDDGWGADKALVDVLDEWDSALRRAHDGAVQAWVTTNDVRPRFAVGAVVNSPREAAMTGDVVRVDERAGTYTVCIAALGHVREGIGTLGHVYSWEDVEGATATDKDGESIQQPGPAVPHRLQGYRDGKLATTNGQEPKDFSAPAPDPEIDPVTKQHRSYWVLSESERQRGFVRPVRRSYRHLKCGTVTRMGLALAETYACKPDFYGATFCSYCHAHFPVGAAGEFVWDGTDEKVGT